MFCLTTALVALIAAAAPAAAPPSYAAGPPGTAFTAGLASAQDDLAEYKRRRKAADGNTEALWKLVDWCELQSLRKQRKSCLRAILKLDDDDTKAHELVGHVFYGGQWFTSKSKLRSFKKKTEAAAQKEEERVAKEQGLTSEHRRK